MDMDGSKNHFHCIVTKLSDPRKTSSISNVNVGNVNNNNQNSDRYNSHRNNNVNKDYEQYDNNKYTTCLLYTSDAADE